MFRRPNKNGKNKQPKDENIREEIRADESFDLNSSIGNQALTENFSEFLDAEERGPLETMALDIDHESVHNNRMPDLVTERPRHMRQRDNDDHSIQESPHIGNVRTRRRNKAGIPEPPKPKKKPLLTGIPEKESDLEDSKSEGVPLIGKHSSDLNNLITNEINKPPLIGMPEKDPDLDGSNVEEALPLIESMIREIPEKNNNENPRREEQSKDTGMNFLHNLITEVRGENNEPDSSEGSLLEIDTRPDEVIQKEREAKRKAKGGAGADNAQAQIPAVPAVIPQQEEDADNGSTYADQQEPSLIVEKPRWRKGKKFQI